MASIARRISARRRSLIVAKDGTIPRLRGERAMSTQTARALVACAASVLTVTALAGRPAANGGPTRLLRMPTVSSTQIALPHANNIWTLERARGMAPPPTRFPGQTTKPHFSPHGNWIAFSGENAGHGAVY